MRYVLVVLALLFTMSCGGGGGGGGGGTCTFDNPVDPTYNLNGQTWNVTYNTPDNNCPDPVYYLSVDGAVSQSGNTLRITGEGITLEGEISDGQMQWGGTINVGGETIRVNCVTVNITGTDIGDTITFSNVQWSSDYGTGTCSGTASGTLTRVS